MTLRFTFIRISFSGSGCSDGFCAFQDNEPLMRALSKLVNLNSPDLVLFVGEALVGNDAVDQLSKFNQVTLDIRAFCRINYYFLSSQRKTEFTKKKHGILLQKLADLSTTPNPRLIDGILLTKFDTIDDKVGQKHHVEFILRNNEI